MLYDITEQGFVLHLDATVYARPAVMKAFYRLQDRYIISYERSGKHLDVYFDLPKPRSIEYPEEIRKIMAELSFEMIRFDTMQETSNLRELLVGRALYATCVDMGHSIEHEPEQDSESSLWQEDQQHIFESWTEET